VGNREHNVIYRTSQLKEAHIFLKTTVHLGASLPW